MAKYNIGDRFNKATGDMRELEVFKTQHIGHTTVLTVTITYANGRQGEYITNSHRLTRMLSDGWLRA